MQRRIVLTLTATAALALAACGGDDGGSGEDFPSQDITLIVPYPAGSGPDSTARALATGMEEGLGQSIVIENVEGANGLIGLSEMAQADSDGYTISWFASPSMTMQWQRIDSPFEGPDTVKPIAQIISVVSVLFANADSGFTSIDDVVAAAKAAPGEISVGLPGEGSQQDIALRQIEEAAGIELDKTYFDAGGQVQPVVNGTVDLGVAQAAPVAQFVEAGDLSWVGVFGSVVPEGIDTEPFTDAGYPAGYEAYEGLAAPADTPDDVVETIAAAAESAVDSAEFTDYISAQFGAANFAGPSDVQERVTNDTATATDLIEQFDLAAQ